ncbi:hypothetical protein DL771_006940 [Monosporascus sp. 5C6A]|nr:hypothetical protein DL771_006940 [Monosporascus sp. 5C6A]
MTVQDNPDIFSPKGSLILVTGAPGYIAGNIIFEALQTGYRVRGTSKSAAKASTSDVSKSANYETVVVPRADVDGALDEAVRYVDAIIPVATPTPWSSDPKEVAGPAVEGVVSILNPALKEPRVKLFVYASSADAATLVKPNEKSDPYLVYSTSEVTSELALWEFVKEHQSVFVVNSVIVKGNVLRELRVRRRFPENSPDLDLELGVVDNTIGVKLLRKWYGQESHASLKESIRQNIEGEAQSEG